MTTNAKTMRSLINQLNESQVDKVSLEVIEDAVVKLHDVFKSLSDPVFDEALYKFDSDNDTGCQRKKDEAVELLKQLRPIVGDIHKRVSA